jgi:hypothetical protein
MSCPSLGKRYIGECLACYQLFSSDFARPAFSAGIEVIFRLRKMTSVLGAFEGVGRNPLRARGALHRIPIA